MLRMGTEEEEEVKTKDITIMTDVIHLHNLVKSWVIPPTISSKSRIITILYTLCPDTLEVLFEWRQMSGACTYTPALNVIKEGSLWDWVGSGRCGWVKQIRQDYFGAKLWNIEYILPLLLNHCIRIEYSNSFKEDKTVKVF